MLDKLAALSWFFFLNWLVLSLALFFFLLSMFLCVFYRLLCLFFVQSSCIQILCQLGLPLERRNFPLCLDLLLNLYKLFHLLIVHLFVVIANFEHLCLLVEKTCSSWFVGVNNYLNSLFPLLEFFDFLAPHDKVLGYPSFAEIVVNINGMIHVLTFSVEF